MSSFTASDESLIDFAKDARDPFQFIAKALCKEANGKPITQDAASSAYQLLSYFLLNEDLARKTNLIPHPDGKIQDVYTYQLKEYLHHKITDVNMELNDEKKLEIIESKLDRRLVKKLFMPMIYGKTLKSFVDDISKTYEGLLSQKDGGVLAKLCYKFWLFKYPDIDNFMKLITLVSWFCSAKDRAAVYGIPYYFTTIQDYRAFVKEQIAIYDRITRKDAGLY